MKNVTIYYNNVPNFYTDVFPIFIKLNDIENNYYTINIGRSRWSIRNRTNKELIGEGTKPANKIKTWEDVIKLLETHGIFLKKKETDNK